MRAAAGKRWRPFTSRSQLADAVNAGKTVLIDFTADWCPNCKFLESTILDTKDVYEVFDKNSVITFRADWTKNDPEITALLNLLSSQQVPVIAIFSATDPNRPIVFKNGYTKAMLLEALEKAGPSRT
jgi:thiol:disulfide interchange protein DsbD